MRHAWRRIIIELAQRAPHLPLAHRLRSSPGVQERPPSQHALLQPIARRLVP